MAFINVFAVPTSYSLPAIAFNIPHAYEDPSTLVSVIMKR